MSSTAPTSCSWETSIWATPADTFRGQVSSYVSMSWVWETSPWAVPGRYASRPVRQPCACDLGQRNRPIAPIPAPSRLNQGRFMPLTWKTAWWAYPQQSHTMTTIAFVFEILANITSIDYSWRNNIEIILLHPLITKGNAPQQTGTPRCILKNIFP